jgi:hypothetical protein
MVDVEQVNFVAKRFFVEKVTSHCTRAVWKLFLWAKYPATQPIILCMICIDLSMVTKNGHQCAILERKKRLDIVS